MKKLILILVCSTLLLAKVQKLSDIEPAEIFYVNLDPNPCDAVCLEDLINNGLYLSFLARFEETKANQKQKDLRELLLAKGDFAVVGVNSQEKTTQKLIPIQNEANIKIAVLIPQKVIKSYSVLVSNGVLAYVARQNLNANIRFYYSGDEGAANLATTIAAIRSQGFSKVIAPLTDIGATIIAKGGYSDLTFYVPTINSDMMPNAPTNIVFGGISYKEQIKALNALSDGKISVFSDGSKLGNMLSRLTNQEASGAAYQREVTKKTDFKQLLEGNKRIKDSYTFLHTPLVLSALISSQAKYYDVSPKAFLSTQINYDPAILSITQPADVKNLFIANSIPELDEQILAYSDILGSDTSYEWVQYAVMLGMEYFYLNYFGGENAVFSDAVRGNQVYYNTRIMKASEFGFIQ